MQNSFKMTKKNLIPIIGVLLLFSSCYSQIPKEKLTIIDNILLGQTKGDYQKQLIKLKIPNRDFYTQWLLLTPERILKNKINLYYTKQFNFDEFVDKLNFIEHFGVLMPDFIDNKTLTSLTVLLGHTNEPKISSDSLKEKGKYLQLRQDISKDLIRKIVNLYTLKYGKPINLIETTTQLEYYLLFENAIQKKTIESFDHFTYMWETEYFDIKFFSGVNLNAFYIPGEGYSQSTNRLYSNLQEGEISGNQQPCYSVPYIKYELNSKGIKKLNLKNLNF